MEAETSRSVKRKPLSDRTNFIPTTTLRSLSSPSLSLFVKPPNPNPNPNPKPKSKPNLKPYNSSTNKPETNSSKSDTSVRSSNTNKNNVPNPRTIAQPHPSTPPPIPPSHSSSTNAGNRTSEIFEPLVVYSRRQTAEKTKCKVMVVAVPFICPPLEKTKDKGKAVSVSISGPPLEKMKKKGKAVAVPFNRFPLVNTKNKGKAVAVPSSCPPLPGTRNIRDELNEAVDIGLSKSCTVPYGKHKKKRHCLFPEQDVSDFALPQGFIEQQKAYFKGVDEFELPEEVAYDELDL
uniref:Sororin C-terminal region domain-containing protein n=1 Tax=Davidia involucrata TaxID=16924 RepID=A0A5B6ZRY2_DAVIN